MQFEDSADTMQTSERTVMGKGEGLGWFNGTQILCSQDFKSH